MRLLSARIWKILRFKIPIQPFFKHEQYFWWSNWKWKVNLRDRIVRKRGWNLEDYVHYLGQRVLKLLNRALSSGTKIHSSQVRVREFEIGSLICTSQDRQFRRSFS